MESISLCIPVMGSIVRVMWTSFTGFMVIVILYGFIINLVTIEIGIFPIKLSHHSFCSVSPTHFLSPISFSTISSISSRV